jgi:toxin ParE1/3/4
MNVSFAPRALRDLEHIESYLVERSPVGALNVLAAIKSSIDALAAFPKIGRSVDNAGHRALPVVHFPYVVFYRVASDEILILHIRHTSRRSINPATDL